MDTRKLPIYSHTWLGIFFSDVGAGSKPARVLNTCVLGGFRTRPYPPHIHPRRLFTAALALTLLAGCASLVPTASPPPPSFYSLDNVRAAVRANMPAAAVPQMQRDAPTLIVNPPHAAAGFDSPRMIFVREQHRLEYFAHSEWIDPPARMLAPLLVAALEDSGAFRAVVLTPSAAVGDVRLDTEIIRLQHEFGAPASSSNPASRVRFTLRAYLVDVKLRTVLARREFDAVIPAASDDPYGGVVAANAAVQSVLQQLAFFCAEAVKEKTP